MSQPAKAQEPSMEEILASIRRIIADDDTTTKPAPPPPPPAAAAPRPAAMPPRTPVPPSPPPRAAEPPPPPPPPPPRVEERPPARPPEPEDILDLTEQMAEPEPPSFQTIDGQNDVIFADPHPEPQRMAEPPRAPAPPPPQPAADPNERPLLSNSTTAAVDSAFNTLAQTVLVQNARTLEDLVREMLRPLLKSWLDDNLPGMVERIVRAEIERVSRGRG
jgi:cell pole-organizing protein PopZ